jgi:hypothetical protein
MGIRQERQMTHDIHINKPTLLLAVRVAARGNQLTEVPVRSHLLLTDLLFLSNQFKKHELIEQKVSST